MLATSTVAKNGKRGLSFAEWLLQCGDRGIITSEEVLIFLFLFFCSFVFFL